MPTAISIRCGMFLKFVRLVSRPDTLSKFWPSFSLSSPLSFYMYLWWCFDIVPQHLLEVTQRKLDDHIWYKFLAMNWPSCQFIVVQIWLVSIYYNAFAQDALLLTEKLTKISKWISSSSSNHFQKGKTIWIFSHSINSLKAIDWVRNSRAPFQAATDWWVLKFLTKKKF